MLDVVPAIYLIKNFFCSSGCVLSISRASDHSSASSNLLRILSTVFFICYYSLSLWLALFYIFSLLKFWVHPPLCLSGRLVISISFGSFPEVSCFSLEHILHCVCVYFQQVGRSATSFLNLKKLPGARMSGVDCGPGQSCSRCEGWGSQGSAESALPGQLKLKVKASWGIWGCFCRGHPGKTAGATGSLGGKCHSSMCKGGQASHLECPEMLCPCVTLCYSWSHSQCCPGLPRVCWGPRLTEAAGQPGAYTPPHHQGVGL